jgi:hypothetical protein
MSDAPESAFPKGLARGFEAPSHRDRELLHFRSLDREQQAAAIRRLARLGMSDHGIAAATALSVEMVRRILSEQHGGR